MRFRRWPLVPEPWSGGLLNGRLSTSAIPAIPGVQRDTGHARQGRSATLPARHNGARPAVSGILGLAGTGDALRALYRREAISPPGPFWNTRTVVAFRAALWRAADVRFKPDCPAVSSRVIRVHEKTAARRPPLPRSHMRPTRWL